MAQSYSIPAGERMPNAGLTRLIQALRHVRYKRYSHNLIPRLQIPVKWGDIKQEAKQYKVIRLERDVVPHLHYPISSIRVSSTGVKGW